MADGDVDSFPAQVGEQCRSLHADFHLRVRRAELTEARHQPCGGEGGLGADREGLAGIDRLQLGKARGDLLEGLAEAGIDLLALRRQAHAMAEALEQDDAGARLQSPELLAYRAGSDAHGRGRAGEIAMAGGFDESA